MPGKAATADMQALAYSDAAIPSGGSEAGLQIALDDIADGTYKGLLSGDKYTTSDDPDKFSVTPTIAPAELVLVLRDGQAQLYCAASVTSEGTVYGVKAPRSPAYVQTLSGTLPLRQVGKTLVRAEGDLTAPGNGMAICWENGKFSQWEAESRDNTYHCTVSILISDGVPTAEITAAGSKSGRACKLRLAYRSEDATDGETVKPISPFAARQTADESRVLWTNLNAEDVKNDAKDYYVMCGLPDCTVTEIETYHYLGDGGEPGQIMLFGEDGGEYGPYDAEGCDGQGGEKNARWIVDVHIDLPAGRYAVADDDQSTWSNNDGTDGWGHGDGIWRAQRECRLSV